MDESRGCQNKNNPEIELLLERPNVRRTLWFTHHKYHDRQSYKNEQFLYR